MDEVKGEKQYAVCSITIMHLFLPLDPSAGEPLSSSALCPINSRPLSFVWVAVGPSWLPFQQGPQELLVDPGLLPVYETHTYPPQPSMNPIGCQTDG